MTPMPKYENPLRGGKACSRERHDLRVFHKEFRNGEGQFGREQ